MSDDGPEIDAYEVRHLSPAQWTALRQGLMRRARDERSRVLRGMVAGLLAAARRAAGTLVKAVRTAVQRHLARQRRLNELRELSAMDDLGLRDIGISRLEVRAALRSNAARLPRRH
jgi:uncharacterized protein YjiS (DUF1127 family)